MTERGNKLSIRWFYCLYCFFFIWVSLYARLTIFYLFDMIFRNYLSDWIKMKYNIDIEISWFLRVKSLTDIILKMLVQVLQFCTRIILSSAINSSPIYSVAGRIFLGEHKHQILFFLLSRTVLLLVLTYSICCK